MVTLHQSESDSQSIRARVCVCVCPWCDSLSRLRLTEEVRELLAGMGSALIKSVKARDNWVFAGRAGSADRSPYEKVSGPPPTHHHHHHHQQHQQHQPASPGVHRVFCSVSPRQTAVNDEGSDAYEGWPGQVEVAGCFPRTQTQQTSI